MPLKMTTDEVEQIDSILNEHPELSSEQIVKQFGINRSSQAISRRRRELGLRWTGHRLCNPRGSWKMYNDDSVAKETECRCPKCGKTYVIMEFYTGHGVLRKFCDYCKRDIERIGVDNYHMTESYGGYGAAIYTRRAGVTVTE